MKIAVGLLTYEIFKNKRDDMFNRTLAGLLLNGGPLDIVIVDNGSRDGTADFVKNTADLWATRCANNPSPDIRLEVFVSNDVNHTSAHGNNLAAAKAISLFDPDIVVLSDDDVSWAPNAFSRLAAFWEKAPEFIKLCGGILESEDYKWAQIIGSGWIGEERFLARESAGAASWSFRARDYGYLFPLYDEKQAVGDLDGCRRLRKQGFSVVQIDLAEHVGAHASSWGNATGKMKFEPLNRKKWQFDE